MRGGAKKDKGMLETELVEKYSVSWEAESVSGGAGEYESGGGEPSMIIRRTTILESVRCIEYCLLN